MLNGCTCRLSKAKDLHKAIILIPPTSASRHQLGEESGIVDVQLVWSDAHDGTVFEVHVADDKDVLAVMEEIVIKFVPEAHCGEAGPWERGERVQGKAVCVEENNINNESDTKACPRPAGDDVEGPHSC